MEKYINLTTDWMHENYNLLNVCLFDGLLGDCTFEVFTSGAGSRGHLLGRFEMRGYGLKYNKRSRRMFLGYNGTWINCNNFVACCQPHIKMNGNYRWTEKAALSTLAHEMCHYYNHMNGYVPSSPHGREFMAIANHISSKCGEIFPIERTALVEQMCEMELDSSIKAKSDQKMANKKSRIIPMLIFKTDGQIRLVNCSSQRLCNKIEFEETRKGSYYRTFAKDNEFKEFIFSKGYKSEMRTYRFWDVTNCDWARQYNQQAHSVLA